MDTTHISLQNAQQRSLGKAKKFRSSTIHGRRPLRMTTPNQNKSNAGAKSASTSEYDDGLTSRFKKTKTKRLHCKQPLTISPNHRKVASSNLAISSNDNEKIAVTLPASHNCNSSSSSAIVTTTVNITNTESKPKEVVPPLDACSSEDTMNHCGFSISSVYSVSSQSILDPAVECDETMEVERSIASTKTSESSFMERFCFLRNELNNCTEKVEEEEDLIVVSQVGQNVKFTYWDIKRVVKNIVNNVMMDESCSLDDLNAVQVAKRMKTLYHQDFTNRLADIVHCLKGAKIKCRRSCDQLKEIRPGLRNNDLATLNAGEWLNDVIINKYLQLLVREKQNACAVDSFFYEELCKNRKATLPMNWEIKEFVLIPICIASHWSLLCAKPKEQILEVYNSMPTVKEERDCASLISITLEYKLNEIMRKKNKWKIILPGELPIQRNEYDCGVYACMFARKVLFNLSSRFSPPSVTQFRMWLRSELIEDHLKS